MLIIDMERKEIAGRAKARDIRKYGLIKASVFGQEREARIKYDDFSGR
jgi:ribosomal protein L25 (general stress protein Ctc)